MLPAQPGFWTLIKEDYIVNGRDWTRPGFRAMFMYRFGVWRMQRSKLIRMPLSVLVQTGETEAPRRSTSQSNAAVRGVLAAHTADATRAAT